MLIRFYEKNLVEVVDQDTQLVWTIAHDFFYCQATNRCERAIKPRMAEALTAKVKDEIKILNSILKEKKKLNEKQLKGYRKHTSCQIKDNII